MPEDRPQRDTDQPLLPGWQRRILDERLAEDDEDPERDSSWEEVKRRILANLETSRT